jgi:hypothetical protein
VKPRIPAVGQEVCDCHFNHTTIRYVRADGDTVELANGVVCSYRQCCDPPDHAYAHPDDGVPWPSGWHAECARNLR